VEPIEVFDSLQPIFEIRLTITEPPTPKKQYRIALRPPRYPALHALPMPLSQVITISRTSSFVSCSISARKRSSSSDSNRK